MHDLVPEDPETTGLLSLLLLQHARIQSRLDPDGRLLPYDQQDRSHRDVSRIAEAKALLATTGRTTPGRYQLEAAIALMHAVAPDADNVNWVAISNLYAALARQNPSAVVNVNRAVAVSRADGPSAALTLLTPILQDPRLTTYLPLHAAHADLLQRADDPAAAAAWRLAAGLAPNSAQRDELLRRADDSETDERRAP